MTASKFRNLRFKCFRLRILWDQNVGILWTNPLQEEKKKQNKSDLTDIPGSSDLKQYNMLYVKILHAKHDFF